MTPNGPDAAAQDHCCTVNLYRENTTTERVVAVRPYPIVSEGMHGTVRAA